MKIIYPRSCVVDVHKSFIVAVICISEVGTDMSQWSSHRKLVAWAGLAPGCNQSTGKKKSVKISKAGVYLKPCLVQDAHAAIKDKKCDYYATKYTKISKRRGKQLQEKYLLLPITF